MTWFGTAFIITCALVLASCVTADRWKSASDEASRISQECRAKRLSGELPNRAASVHCANDRMRQAWLKASFPHMDLVDLALAFRAAIAKRIDAGELSEEEGQLKSAELNARINSEVQRRDALRRQVETLEYSTFLQGLALWQQSVQPAPQPFPPRTLITCSRIGNSIFCQ